MRKIFYLLCASCLAFSSSYTMGSEEKEPVRVELGKRQDKEKPSKEKGLKQKSSQKIVTKSAAGKSVYHPYYYIKSIGANGKTLAMYDETVWEISSSGSYTARNWSPDSPIIIQLNHSWLSSYDYRIFNPTTNESVSANLALGPFAQNAIYITDINPYTNVISLSNGSYWVCNYWDTNSPKYKQWKEGQAVLIGETDTWFSPYYILININENNSVSVSIR